MLKNSLKHQLFTHTTLSKFYQKVCVIHILLHHTLFYHYLNKIEDSQKKAI